ncbi:MAG: HAMP domain-containing histidine kinase [Lachnospiraceae bacterium]|jgi:signal transduction histidine kinase|nr:HAMP domain-containing histidine kinase [Lachnospiraceae bacterium]
MRKRILLISLLLLFFAEAAVLLAMLQKEEKPQDAVVVNEVLQSVQADWERLEGRGRETEEAAVPGLAYVVLDLDGAVLYQTKDGLSETINEAVLHRDTILDVEAGGDRVGKLIIYNDSREELREERKTAMLLLMLAISVQLVIFIVYFFYLNRAVIKPFQKLKGFAERIAGGNLDIPLEMDRKNLFGAFTEAFDLMRSELKRARLAEAEANREKKELVAKLSHDIRTPVASIKAAAEVGEALVESRACLGDFDGERLLENYGQIIRKADQMNALVTELFTAALEEIGQLPVTPEDMDGGELSVILENADYLHRAAMPAISPCLIWADRLRIQQVFDNLFANSYKYSGTDVKVKAERKARFLIVTVEDFGGGVGEEELPFLKEKFKRGKNAQGTSGAGLGLYISDYFMREMGGELSLSNGERGFKAAVKIRLSGDLRIL